MNFQIIAILTISILGLIFLVFGGVSWFLQKVDEFENHPHRERE